MIIQADLNQLEPQTLVDAFLHHPPNTFQIHIEQDTFNCFTTDFNLLTTLDIPVKKRIESVLGYQFWGEILHLPTCFIGTTVNEYTPLLSHVDPVKQVTAFKDQTKNNALCIIKDLPLNSPLLTQQENKHSQKVIQAAEKIGFLSVEGQALAYVPIDFENREDYLARLSKSRRKNLKRKLKSLNELRVETLRTGDPIFKDAQFRTQLYQLFLNVYDQSEIHFDLLTAEFFDDILQNSLSNGVVFCYWKDKVLVGYNICYEYRGNLVDKYIGLNYPLATEYNLYFISWFVNLDYAKQHKLKFYIAGWTDPEVKAQLGAKFTFTQHLVWIRQPILRFILGKMKHLFEADSHWHEQKESK